MNLQIKKKKKKRWIGGEHDMILTEEVPLLAAPTHQLYQ